MSPVVPVGGGWAPLVYFWEGGWIGVGAGRGVVPPHAHHAIQICIGLDGPIRLRHGEDEWMDLTAGVVLPDVVHSFDALGSTTALIFIDPESFLGQWLRDSSATPIRAVDRERLRPHLPALIGFRDERPGACVRRPLHRHEERRALSALSRASANTGGSVEGATLSRGPPRGGHSSW